MKKYFISLVLLVTFTINNVAFGTHVTPTTAQLVATRVANSDHLKSASLPLSLVYARENAFYVFSNTSGFIIVAADDRVTPILGYSTEGPFIVPEHTNDTTMGNNFWGLMQSFEHQIQYVVDNNLSATDAISTQWAQLKSGQTTKSTSTVVLPLLTTTWDQGWPYNSMCPVDPSGSGGHVWAGCVATAMAQILKYHNYPNQGLGSYGYTWGSYPNTSANFGATTYNWSGMPNSTSTVDADVATLIYHTAVSCRSMWGPGVTGVGYTDQDPMTRAFVNYFRCAFSTIKYLSKSTYTSTEWDNLIQNELTNNRPVYYRGDGSFGHAFVCDGVDASNMYHFNFGWGGAYNGYFLLSAIAPGANNFTNNQGAIIGIKPNDGSTLEVNTTWSGLTNKSTHVAVPDAITLTVTAGTMVKFAQNCKLQVWGQLLSTGTSSNYATFTAVDTTAGWWGIKFDNDYMNYEVMLDNDTSRFIYSQIQYADMRGITIKNFSKVVIDHCKINNNFIDADEYGYNGHGGGVLSAYSAVQIYHSELYKNHATIYGGGFVVGGNDISTAKIVGNDIYQNISDMTGGGFSLSHTSIFSDNLVHHNQAISGAGGSLAGGIGVGEMSLLNNKFCNNSTISSSGKGGALYLDACSPKIVNNLFANNTSLNGGALVITNGATPLLVNNTISKNFTQNVSSISLGFSSDPTFKNTIMYDNYNGNGKEFYLGNTGCDPIFDHCDLQGGINALGGPGSGTNYDPANYTNTIDALPLFVSPSGGTGAGYNGLTADWSMQSTSPCINTGDTNGVSTLLPALDLGGNPRINGIIDMGAYEYGCTPVPVSVIITATTNPVCAGTTVTFTATPTNGGTPPVYQWKKNGSIVGSNSSTYAYVPVNGDVITCVLTSNLSCVTGNPATSNAITMTVNELSSTFAGNDQSIGYGASAILNGSTTGGSGTYNWNWEPADLLVNPNIQDPTTIHLTSTVLFILTATDVESGCTGTDTVSVIITGLPLSLEVSAEPGTSCAGNAIQLHALPLEGTGSYIYIWTSEPGGFISDISNPAAYPVITTTYTVVVNDGYATLSDFITVTVNPLPPVPVMPTGPAAIDLLSVTETQYSIPVYEDATAYSWELAPGSAGLIAGFDNLAMVTWDPGYLGDATIRVKSLNFCGESSWSAPKVTFVNNTTGINGEVTCRPLVYPNPSNGSKVMINFCQIIGHVEIIDAKGLVLYSAAPGADHWVFQPALAKGIYFVKVIHAKGIAVEKLIVD